MVVAMDVDAIIVIVVVMVAFVINPMVLITKNQLN